MKLASQHFELRASALGEFCMNPGQNAVSSRQFSQITGTAFGTYGRIGGVNCWE